MNNYLLVGPIYSWGYLAMCDSLWIDAQIWESIVIRGSNIFADAEFLAVILAKRKIQDTTH